MLRYQMVTYASTYHAKPKKINEKFFLMMTCGMRTEKASDRPGERMARRLLGGVVSFPFGFRTHAPGAGGSQTHGSLKIKSIVRLQHTRQGVVL